ncbi:hypothetical protein BCH308197_A0161 (plasmid) [Bacillus cereus H3081.97]|uniref:Uncharacterized protein n=1 Tax=Bacillus cereus (strain AH187) TaxID=405534 RepID=B7I170_BACC7|nr:hypothetical protein BCH308197_A0161 [Bacillus cereus H3081.97]ACJ82848.1 hypothetical protein BCAH187_C0100 [Bacillus cereus AH187]
MALFHWADEPFFAFLYFIFYYINILLLINLYLKKYKNIK